MNRLLLGGLLLLMGCDALQPRTPETPETTGGTFLQPDTPEQVVENVQAAIAELNTTNYRRSFAQTLTFTPTLAAEARDGALWTTWSRTEEEGYFSTLAAAAQFASGHELRLDEQTTSIVGTDRFLLDARYTLTVQHRRTDVATSVQGRLIWTITQGDDGLWSIAEWTDRAITGNASWSDLKASFIQ